MQYPTVRLRLPLLRRPARRLAALLAPLLALAVFVGCSTLDERQREWIFRPVTETPWAGPNATLGMEDVWIDFASAETGARSRLHGVWLARAQADAPVLLYLHGARWDVTGSASRVRRMSELGFSVLAIDYRGFGKSSAALPSEALAREDARIAWQWLAARQPAAPRYIFGHSLGGAIAVDLASRVTDEAGLIVEGSFTSIPDVFASMRWGWLPLGPLITQRFEAVERIGEVGAPVLIVHGSKDTLIPPALGRSLYDKAAQPKRWLLVDGGSHHSTNAVGEAAYREALHELFGLGGAGVLPPLGAASP
ncbi:MAG TPA: alpha/beta fold hydrolase [Methylibium sp.]|uniref:alpha/beta hydrolase n=1 Tax=Methylibium sp. TaxID=2067992 RepID=UPI002DB6EF22|nr:alpha/beta fold hydrolase [Methylibium sp.]HEU4460263.1 alpha/beta fold hydrolase [Methylibium sp.]